MLVKIVQTVDIKETRFVPVGKNHFTIVDKSVFVMVRAYKWRTHKSHSLVYVVRTGYKNGKRGLIFIHRWLTHCPTGMEVHHKNGNTFDNRRDNLEIVHPKYHPRIRIFSEIRGL